METYFIDRIALRAGNEKDDDDDNPKVNKQ